MVWYSRFLALLTAVTLSVSTAQAGAILIDLDLGTAGVQSSRDPINVGEMFEAAIIFEFGDNESFGGASFDLNFNDAGGVLSIAGFWAGTLTNTEDPGSWRDLFGSIPLLSGAPLSPGGSASPEFPFVNAIDGGIQNITTPITRAAGIQVQLATFKVTGLSAGTSNLAFDEVNTRVTNAMANADLDTFGTASVTVMGNGGVVPEPSSIVVWAFGSTLAVGFRRRRR